MPVVWEAGCAGFASQQMLETEVREARNLKLEFKNRNRSSRSSELKQEFKKLETETELRTCFCFQAWAVGCQDTGFRML